MGDLSKNISRSEIRCPCGCGFDTIDFGAVEMWQECCDWFANTLGVPKVKLVIHSGSRCKKHNKQVGGSPGSRHRVGKAIDAHIVGITMDEVYSYFLATFPNSHGISEYETFVHGDCREDKGRW